MIISVQNHLSREFEFSMEERKNILKEIIEYNLLAPSAVELAKLLNLKTKSTLYRILKGTAQNAAISTLCQALEEKLDIDGRNILAMGILINDYKYLSTLLQDEPINKNPEKVALSFVAGDYSGFSKHFVENHLNEIIQYANDAPEVFFSDIFYFYIRRTFIDFYVKKLPFLKQCERVILPLADKLRQQYPANQLGKNFITLMLQGDVYLNNVPTLWKCINAGGTMLKYYASPNAYQKLMANYIILPDTDERSFWLTNDPEQIIMTFADSSDERSGGYMVFKVDFQNDKLKCIGSVGFTPQGYFEIFISNNETLRVGKYQYQNRNLIFTLPDGSNPLGVGNRWRLLNIDTIPEIKSFNDRIDYWKILRAMGEAEGFEVLTDYLVSDVIISRNEVKIWLVSGKKLTIQRSAHEFLSSIGPSDLVTILRFYKDNTDYVVWSDLNYRIPLSEFKEE